MALQRLAEEEARQQGGRERRGAEHQQHVGDRRQAERQDEGDEAAGQQQRAQQKGGARIANVDQVCRAAARKAVAASWQRASAERQNDTSQAGRSIWRTITPAVLKTAAAPMAYGAPSAAELCDGTGVFIPNQL